MSSIIPVSGQVVVSTPSVPDGKSEIEPPVPLPVPVASHEVFCSKSLTTTSPRIIRSPMLNHDYEKIANCKTKEIRKLQKKFAHTLANLDKFGNATSTIKNNFPVIRKLVFNSKEDERVITHKIGNSILEIYKDENRINHIENGTQVGVGLHDVVLDGGIKQIRIYPKEGPNVITLSGSQVKAFREEYNQKKPKITFEEFIQNAVESAKSSSVTNP